MGYGLRVNDADGNSVIITPDTKNIINSGTVQLPLVLHPDNTFGINIPLPGSNAYDENSIGVLVKARNYLPYYESAGTNYYATVVGAVGDGRFCHWVGTSLTMFTRNESTGALSTFAVEQYKDTCYNFYPVAFWDKLGQTSFNYIRLFAAVVFNIYDHSSSTYKQIYQLALINEIDYVVFLKDLK